MTKLLLATDRQLQFENVSFAFRTNFEGRKERYNREGERYFNIKIEDAGEAEELMSMGFNIKMQSAEEQFGKINSRRESEGQPLLDRDQFEDYWYMKVPIYTTYSVPVIQIRDVTDIPDLDEETRPVTVLPVELFREVDDMEMDNVDIILTYRPPHPEGKYLRPQLKTMYIDVVSSPLERKHRL